MCIRDRYWSASSELPSTDVSPTVSTALVPFEKAYQPSKSLVTQYNHPQLKMHPQTLEDINALPTPTQLAYSASHSLTSFKKQPFKNYKMAMQSALQNGTLPNPMDNPDMFYINTHEGPLMKKVWIPQPHHLRKSIVMTDPNVLSKDRTFKPAGSVRIIQEHANTQLAESASDNPMRVSELLDSADMAHTGSVGGILPVSNSNDGLRRELGTSHNYNIFI